MIDPASRYYPVATAKFTLASGKTVAYKQRRFLPPAQVGSVAAVHQVAQGERLDNITAQHLRDPQLFWQVCDVNNAMHPDDLTAEVGRWLKITLIGT